MPDQWTADVIALMHLHKIRVLDLAKQLGFRPEYVSIVLNGHRQPLHAEEKFRNALDVLIAQREEQKGK